MSEPAPTYDQLRSAFAWSLPTHVNIGVEVCERQPAADPAILVTDGREITRTVSFGELSESSNRLANVLAANGVVEGDRVALILSQRPETVIAHIAIYKLGAIVVPLSGAFGRDALEVRLRGSDPRAVLGERESLERVAALGFDGVLIDVDLDLERLLAEASPDFDAAATTPDSPALLVYTSGTTGSPKGALHGHRVLAGHMPGFELSHDFFPQPGDRIWTPADWAWIGGLYDVVMPALAHGTPVVAFRHAEVRSRAGLRRDRERGDPERLHARDGAADDATERRSAGRPAHDRERGRDGGRGDGGLVPGAVRGAAERVLRSDRGEPADRELRCVAGAAWLDGPSVSRARAAPRRR